MNQDVLRIIEYICDYKFNCDELNIDLIESGILDSMNLVRLIIELENEFDIVIQPTQVIAHTWHSIALIEDLVEECIRDNNIEKSYE